MRGSIYGDVVMLFGVYCLGVVEGKVEWRGSLSETIKGTGMRESRKEGKECGKVGKTQ